MELVFGGSFDPPTLAHVLLPKKAMHHEGADRVRFVIANTSPHKVDHPPLVSSHRLAMLKLALAEAPWACIDTRELDREGPSYMIDTLESLHSDVPMHRRLLIGSDQATAFHRWHRWADIIELASPLVLMRDSDSVDAMLADIEHHQGTGARERWKSWVINVPRRPDSSTHVRKHQSLDHVPDSVAAYIQTHELYGVHA